MLKLQIEKLKEELNLLIDDGLNTDEIYKLSTELDKLIIEFYLQKDYLHKNKNALQM